GFVSLYRGDYLFAGLSFAAAIPAAGALASAATVERASATLARTAIVENVAAKSAVQTALSVERVEAATTRVGRWMSKAEFEATKATGRVQESITHSGITSVSRPPNPSAWRPQELGRVFVEFDVPASAVRAGDASWGKIYG